MEDSENFYQAEVPINLDSKQDIELSTIYESLLDCIRKTDRCQEHLGYLSRENLEILNAIKQQNILNNTGEIEATKQEVTTLSQGVTSLGQGVWKIYQHLEKDNIGKELKSGQQNLQKAIEASSQKKTTANIGYLDWKQIATIITATAIVSSLCSLAVFQIAANWKTDQIPTEKPLKPKKTAR